MGVINTDMSGGASFTPRLEPRPEYPSATGVIYRGVLGYIRGPAIATVLATVFFPLFSRAVAGWTSGICEPFKLERATCEQGWFVLSITAVHTILYVTINGFFHCATARGWFERYRIERKESQLPTRDLLLKTWSEAAVGQLFFGPVALWFGVYPLAKYMGMPSIYSELPSPLILYKSFVLCRLVNDWGFYWSHRIAHCKALYRHVHKQHHTYTGTIGFAAEYANPVEQIMSNQGPTMGAALFGGLHHWIWLVWLVERLEQTYEGHSGYAFVGTQLHKLGLTNADAACYHDFHHTGNSGNFGVEYLDYFCGTMDSYIKLGGRDGYLQYQAEQATKQIKAA